MKREDVSRIFEGATEEQISSILDLNSQDVGKAKRGGERLQADLEAAQSALSQANQTITALEAAKGDSERLQAELNRYQQAEAERLQREQAAQARAELLGRMDAVMGGRSFLHERMRELVAEDFKAALEDRANLGKSDSEIFDGITKDKGYFASQNPPVEHMGGFGPVSAPDTDKMSDAEYYASIFKKG